MSSDGSAAEATRTLDDIPGWFTELDRRLFRAFLDFQDATQPPGDLVELGAYLGKSAVLIGEHPRSGETFTVCDLFEGVTPDMANQAEYSRSYATLTRDQFERNYLAFHRTLPRIVQAPTARILDHVEPSSCRFVHVDASHLYEHVREDAGAARVLLGGRGMVAFDDYRAAHTPGVAAAVWEAVLRGGLAPICVTPNKLYGTWGDPGPLRRVLLSWLGDEPDYEADVQQVAGHELVRVVQPRRRPPQQRQPSTGRPRPAPDRPAASPPSGAPQNGPTAPAGRSRSRVRKLARDWLPPVLTRRVRRLRRRRSRR